MPFDQQEPVHQDQDESLAGLIAFLQERTIRSGASKGYAANRFETCALAQYLASIGKPPRLYWSFKGLSSNEASHIFGCLPHTWAGALARAQAEAARQGAERAGTATDPSEQPKS